MAVKNLVENLPTRLSQRVGSATVLAVTLAAIAICSLAFLMFLASRDYLTKPLINADALLPADLVHRVFVLGRPWSDFQLPQLPSFFPDLLIYVPAQLLWSWRIASLAFAWFVLAALITAGALIVHRMTERPFWLCATVMLALTIGVFVGELLSGGDERLSLLPPVTHGGQFVMSLFVVFLCEASEAAVRWTRALYAAIAILTCAIVLSDQLAFCELSIAATGASWFWSRTRKHAWSIVAAITLGTIASFLIDATLVREHGALLLGRIPRRIWTALTTLPLSFILAVWLPAALFVLIPPFILKNDDEATRIKKYYCLAGSLAIFWTAGLAYGFLFVDMTHVRYLGPLLWWPVIGVAALVVQLLDSRVLFRSVAAAMLSAFFAVGAAGLSRWTAAPLLSWRHPLEDCVRNARQAFGLHQELAGYWFARPLTVSSGWTLQIDQIFPEGNMMLWGNDHRSYSYRLDQQNEQPTYDFALMISLDPKAMAVDYGEPDSMAPCDSTTIAIYQKPIKPERMLKKPLY